MSGRRLTPEEIAAVKRGTHPVSDEAFVWAEEQMALIEAGGLRADIDKFSTVDEFRERVYAKFPHLRPTPPSQGEGVPFSDGRERDG